MLDLILHKFLYACHFVNVSIKITKDAVKSIVLTIPREKGSAASSLFPT